MTQSDSKQEISRRRVLVGTAWATPAIIVAVGVPQAAASTTIDGDAIIVSSSAAGVGWGSSPNSVGLEISAYYAWLSEWQAAGITEIPATLTLTVSDGVNTYSKPVSIVVHQSGDAYEVIIEDIPPGDYELSYSVIADPIVVDGVTYQANDVFGGPIAMHVPDPDSSSTTPLVIIVPNTGGPGTGSLTRT
ncbi:hypothetical protein [Demequina sp.]|uniref:hypothetical protein n=1 Tax=Demequina sp. TaxID=2050685 RepID=UPI003A8C600F